MNSPNAGKQIKVLAALWLVLLLVIFSPTLRLGTGALQARDIHFQGAQLTIPKGWTYSENTDKMTVSKPCFTIFCGAARAGFIVEAGKLPEKLWLSAATKNLQRMAPGADITTVEDAPGTECIEADLLTADGKVTASCLNSDLHLASTFRGDPSLKQAFYQVLATARRSN